MTHQDISLKAACADSFYYPQEWNPSRGSLDSFRRKQGFEHHLGANRVKNLSKGELLIRFELPFKVQCCRCGDYYGQGTRYDADKKKIGMYFSTPLFQFVVRCGGITTPELSADGTVHCNQRWVIKTDPENDDYACVEGLRKKVETWDAKDTGTIELVDPETRRKMVADPMFKVEKTIRDVKKEKSDKERLVDLQDLMDEREDIYSVNCAMRKVHRAKRKEEKAKEEAERLAGKPNFAVILAPASEEDRREAKAVVFKTDHDKIERAVRRSKVLSGPVVVAQKRALVSSALVSSSRGGSSSPGQAKALVELVAKRRRLEQHARMAKVFG